MTDAAEEWRGWWWLPGAEDRAVPGTLHRNDNGEVELRLVGGFSVEILTPTDDPQISTVSFGGVWPIILGNSGGQLFTLLKCSATRTSGGFAANIVEQNVSALRALRGIHLKEPNEPIFDSATFEVEYMLGWSTQSTMSATVQYHGGARWSGHQTASTEPAADLIAKHDGLDYRFSVAFTQFRVDNHARANERRLTTREWGQLTVTAPSPASFERFDHVSKAIMDMQTLVAHAPAGVLRYLATYTPSEDHPSHRSDPLEVEVFGKMIHQPRSGLQETQRVEYLFTVHDQPFDQVLPRWLDIHERSWLACSMLFGLSYIPAGYTTSRLLTAATAAESLHRSLHPGTNTYFKARLEDLANRPDPTAVEMLISDVPAWAEYIKRQRNGMAHGDRDRLDAGTGRMAFDALEVTKALLGLVLMSELDLSADVQRRAVQLQYLAIQIREFNEALAQS